MSRASLADLVRERAEDVETVGGTVRVQSAPYTRIADLMDKPPAEQAAELLAVCVVDPPMAVEDAKALPADITMQLVQVAMRLCGLDAPD